MSGKVDYNLTAEQKERFNLILEETKKVHPEILMDEASIHRVKTLIAFTVINGDDALKPKTDELEEQNVFNEITE